MKLTGPVTETIRIPSNMTISNILIDPVTMTWTIVPAAPARREPTPEEKIVHRAISANTGDGKRYGHRDYTGSDD